MYFLKEKGSKIRYEVRDKQCAKRPCLALGIYRHRGATLSGSRNTGESTPCCLTRANRGCPPESHGEK